MILAQSRLLLLLAVASCLGLCWTTPMWASSDPFATGNTLYKAGAFADAARDYEIAIHDGRLSANLFFNLGNAYYRLGDRGRAVLNYRRALALEPDHAEAAANLAFVGGKPAVRSGVGSSWWRVGPWAVAAVGWLGVVGLLMAVASRRRHLFGLVVAVGGLMFCAVGATAIWQFGKSDDATRAVVVTEAAPAKYSPADNAKVVTSLAAGSEVRLLSEQGAWDYVLLADGTTRAWLASGDLESFVPR